MEKKQILKLFKAVMILGYLVTFIGFAFLELWFRAVSAGVSVMSFIYWMIFIGWVFLVLGYKPEAKYTFILALVFFAISVLAVSLGASSVGEAFMRLSFLGWVIGLPQAWLEYKKINETNN